MAMSIVWIAMLTLSVLFGILNDSASAVGAAALTGARSGVEATLAIAGALCLWSGLGRVLEHSGLSEKLTHLLAPLLRRLFPRSFRDPAAAAALSANFAANLLGLGNAATPMGVAAARRMQALSGSEYASDELCRLVVLNTASVQLLPATVAALRAGLGAAKPMQILPAVWLSSLLSVGTGLGAAALFARGGRR